MSVETHPGRPDLPRQKIKLEIANIPAYTREVVPLRMNYSVLDGVSPTLVVAEYIHEILADKLVALPTSFAKIEAHGIADTPARIRYWDVWDIAWLTGQGAEVDLEMVRKKVADYGIQEFPRLMDHAISQVPEIAACHTFRQQMSRFVERSKHEKMFGMPGYEGYFARSVNTLLESALRDQNILTQQSAGYSSH
ncbi:nucleotidyl transferase AbiEii/AbiGii toxin family protein [Acidithiobacillus albertensis]|nr:nucleotidyl transferase AbiEii/AbiGii toxin family protein [Acidithiobacillus albertensis]